ncbi:hypothetical protein NKH77_22760 [Streptomyces sp. M19]
MTVAVAGVTVAMVLSGLGVGHPESGRTAVVPPARPTSFTPGTPTAAPTDAPGTRRRPRGAAADRSAGTD